MESTGTQELDSMKCQIDWCGKKIYSNHRLPFDTYYCPDCKIYYFLVDGILETLSIEDFPEYRESQENKNLLIGLLCGCFVGSILFY
jgi:hypothetical protein